MLRNLEQAIILHRSGVQVGFKVFCCYGFYTFGP